MTSGYKVSESFAEVDNVVNFLMNVQQSANHTGTNEVYGVTMSQNFLVELTGYFLAPISGAYTFKLTIDDACILQLGSGVAFPCDEPTENGSSSDAMFAHWDWPNQLLGKDSRVYTLKAGSYYPIKMVYVNAIGPIVLDVTATINGLDLPLEDYMYNVGTATGSVITVTSAWSGTKTATSTITPEDPKGTTTIEVLTPTVTANIPTDIPTACMPPTSDAESGLYAAFFPYVYGDSDSLRDIKFMTKGYKDLEKITSVSEVVDFELDIDQTSSATATNLIYGKSISQNFLVELKGYFLAPESTDYTFKLSADDGAILQLGSGMAFPCCDLSGDGSQNEYETMHVIKDGDGDPGSETRVFTVKKGVYYPLRIVYANMGGPVYFSVSVSTPNSAKVPLSKYLYSLRDKWNGCPAFITTVTTPWSGSTYSTTTISPADDDGTTTIEV